MAPRVVLHGQVDQAALGRLMRRAAVFVLPSFFEGLPLVLVEARACGCRLVATRLSGVEGELAPHLGESLALVDLPALEGPDEPVAADLPAFVARLEAALSEALGAARAADGAGDLTPFTWGAVFARVETVWRALAGRPAEGGPGGPRRVCDHGAGAGADRGARADGHLRR